MKYLISMLIAMTLAGAAVADPPDFIPPGHQYGGSGGSSSASAQARASASSRASAQTSARQAQGQLQGQSVTVNNGLGLSAADQANVARITAGGWSDTYSEYVAAAFAPPLVATSDCMGSASAGGSNSVMGFSIGKTYIDAGCNARADSRHLWSMGLKTEATARLCTQPAMAKVLGDKCPKDPEEDEDPVVAAQWYNQ